MERRKKYTHITAKCSPVIRAYSAMRLLDVCGMTLSEAYWRQDSGLGLLCLYDNESLNEWSDIITTARRTTGSPFPMPMRTKFKDNLRASLEEERNEVYESMERYRDWLSEGSRPLRLKDLCKSQGSELVLPYAMREVLLQMGIADPDHKPVDEIRRFIRLVDIGKVLELADEWGENITDYYEAEYTRWANGSKGMEPKILDFVIEWAAATGKPSLDYCGLYQIRADMEHRKSSTSKMYQYLNWLHDVPRLTDESHRAIYAQNRQVLSELAAWKKACLDERAAVKGNGDKFSYDPYEVYGKTIAFLHRLQVPPIPVEWLKGHGYLDADIQEEERRREERIRMIQEDEERRQLHLPFE